MAVGPLQSSEHQCRGPFQNSLTARSSQLKLWRPEQRRSSFLLLCAGFGQALWDPSRLQPLVSFCASLCSLPQPCCIPVFRFLQPVAVQCGFPAPLSQLCQLMARWVTYVSFTCRSAWPAPSSSPAGWAEGQPQCTGMGFRARL